jgi:sec-independent protein translocase protein TatC
LATEETVKQVEPLTREDAFTILEHLAELRDRLIRAVIALVVATLLAFLFTDPLLEFLIQPMGGLKPVFLRPTEMFVTYFKVSLIAGFILSMPVIIYQLMRFLAPGLTREERKYLYIIVPGGTISFAAGVLFSYFVMLPVGIRFLLTFGGDIARAQWTIGEYISFITTLMFWAGVVFETPLIIFFLAKLGIVTAQQLSRWRKFAILGIFIIAAVITPTPDPINQLLVAGPLLVLYELGVLLARIA